jgi:hypothetical protein
MKSMVVLKSMVVPAKAGTPFVFLNWIPACAGATAI